MKAGLYCRVSTDTQNEGYSIDAQKELMEAYCKAREIDEYEYYVDGGFSGSNIARPMMEKLIADCKAKKLDVVIVYKLDRLSRSQKDTLFLIEEIFLPNSVAFISISENFDTTTPFGKAMIGILSVFAQLEREMIKERTRMGMRERVKNGFWPGGGKTPWGYRYDSASGILIPNERAPVVKRMYELYASGWSADKIANHFDLKYDKLVMQILASKANCGLIELKGEVYEGRHTAIVDRELFDEVQDRIRKRKKSNARSTPHLLTGLTRCGICGAKMRYQKWGNAGDKILCYSQQSTKKYMIRDRTCTNEKFWAYEVEDAVISQLKQFSLNPALISARIEEQGESRTGEIKKSLADTERKMANLLSFLAEGVAVEEVKEKLASLSLQKTQLSALLKEVEKKVNKADSFKRRVEHLSDVWDELSYDEKSGILHTLIDTVTLTKTTLSIVWSFE